MCARFTATREADEFAHYFGVPAEPDHVPRYNIAPGQPVPVVRLAAGRREVVRMRWGLVPAWAATGTPQAAAGLPNAKAETAREKPAFRDAARSRRCLVPADGFIEWEAAAGAKHPHWFRLADGRMFALAGLWEPPARGDRRQGETFTILTVPAGPDVAFLHDRMPAILFPEQFAPWLGDGCPPGWDDVLRPLPAGLLESAPVNPALNHPAADHPGLLVRTPVGLFD